MNGRVPEQGVQDIELHDLGGEKEEESGSADEERPLNHGVTRTSQTVNSHPCSEIVFGICKLWMVITSGFLLLIFVIIISLVFYSAMYIDEDEHWDIEAIANGNHRNFSGILKIHCANPDWLLSESAHGSFFESLSKRLTDVYNNSPALGRYFISAEVISFSNENKTASFELEFLVPPETEEFTKNRMSETFVKDVLRQNVYDQQEMSGVDVTGCTDLTLDPTAISVSSMQVIDTDG